MDGVGLAWHSWSVFPVIVESFSISLLSGSDDEEYNLQNKFLIVGQREREEAVKESLTMVFVGTYKRSHLAGVCQHFNYTNTWSDIAAAAVGLVAGIQEMVIND